MDNADHTMTVEEQNLRSSWDCYPPDWLDRYLVCGVEDPRINAQSILIRALLADTIHLGRFDALITEELRFSAVLTWLLQRLEQGSTRGELLDALDSPCLADVPEFILDAYRWLQSETCPIADYLSAALSHRDYDLPPLLSAGFRVGHLPGALERATRPDADGKAICPGDRLRLGQRLSLPPPIRPRAAFALHRDRHCRQKHRECRQPIPKGRFPQAKHSSTDFPDSSYDCVFCHDLLEHLSLPAMERALAEMLRIAVAEVIIHFFNAKWDG